MGLALFTVPRKDVEWLIGEEQQEKQDKRKQARKPWEAEAGVSRAARG